MGAEARSWFAWDDLRPFVAAAVYSAGRSLGARLPWSRPADARAPISGVMKPAE
jgi:hypothetical protein